jgi:hypothetical protein
MLNEALILVTRYVNVTYSRMQKENRIVGEVVDAALKLHRRFGPTRILPLLVRTFAPLRLCVSFFFCSLGCFLAAFFRTHARGRSMKWILLCWFLFVPFVLKAQEATSDGKIMLTVILRHDQSKTLDEIDDHLVKTGFIKSFPPEGVEIVSYNIVMGVGHIITLRLPPDKLREVNVAFEKGVWGAFRTEFYPTYDYLRIFNDLKQNAPAPQAETSPASPARPTPSPTPTPKRTIHHRS